MTRHTTERRRGRALPIGVVLALVVVLLPALWLGVRSSEAAGTAASLGSTADQLRADATAFDLAAVARDITTLHDEAASLHQITGDPVWGVATALPIVGARASAAREIGSVADDLATAALPLATLLPHFDRSLIQSSGGHIDVGALAALGPVLSSLSTAVASGAASLGGVDRAGLTTAQADQVDRLHQALIDAESPLRSAATTVPLLAHLLGADGPRTWFVALQNLAEARGTGGLVGAYAVLRTDAGKVSLVEANSDKVLVSGPPIPDGNLPAEFQQLWESDAQEWNGLNLSPHFPYTGQLVLDGWKARGGTPLDGVIGIDQTVVAALLAGTGPVTVRGVTVDSASAFQFLTRDIYARFPVITDKDAVVGELVRAVFQKLAAGQVALGPMVKALSEPVSQGHFQVWSAHPDEESQLAKYSVAGVLPDAPGPFAMVAVNNGAGNKLDAYTAVTVDYQLGTCAGPIRTSTIHITVHDGAPKSGLAANVAGRLDLPPAQQASAPRGSTKVLLYVYGPVDSANGLTTLDGQQVDVSEGLERGHPVWRVDVVLLPGQTRTVDVEMIENVDPSAPTTATVGVQPMAVPQVVRVTPCTAS